MRAARLETGHKSGTGAAEVNKGRTEMRCNVSSDNVQTAAGNAANPVKCLKARLMNAAKPV